MATVYANLRATQRATGTASNKLDGNALGDVRCMVTSYTVSGTVAIGDVIEWGELPVGARLLPGSKLFWSTGAASSTLNLGDTGSAARYLAATAVTTAGSATAEAQLASGATYDVTATTTVLRSTVAGATLQAGQVITLHAYYQQV